jgi:ApbE superfamily uncharacterized protein (UPF0280 family)
MLDARRLHLNHGPIDLIIRVWGRHWRAALAAAEARFQTVLIELVDELDLLRAPLGPVLLQGVIARRMAHAVAPFDVFVTPMAAVAGALADEVLAALVAGHDLGRAYVNNGGDIACYLGPGQVLRAAVPGFGAVTLDAAQTARGLATSGWRGRSHSFGIADAVSVVAGNAAAADVAATLIANAVDLPEHGAIKRQAARDLLPDSDLGGRLVTVGVGALTVGEVAKALTAGRDVAARMLAAGQISAAALFLDNQNLTVGDFPGEQVRDEKNARLQIA